MSSFALHVTEEKGNIRAGLLTMEKAFEAKPITDEFLRSAHAVLQLGFPDLTLQNCRALKAGSRSPGTKALGLMGIFDRRRYVHAVFRCRKEPYIPVGRHLRVYDFIASDLIAAAMLSQMVKALERLALAEGCDHLTIEALQSEPNTNIALPNLLIFHGFSRNGVTLTRPL